MYVCGILGFELWTLNFKLTMECAIGLTVGCALQMLLLLLRLNAELFIFVVENVFVACKDNESLSFWL